MLDFTNIDAIQFLQNGVNNFRVYYQNADNSIRESCFDDKRRWYTTGNVIARDAKENSPIAVTRWNGGTEIRVYYLNTSNRISEMVGKSAVGQSTQWAPGGDLSAASVAPESQIGIARPGRDDSSLRVYYQEASWSVSSLAISEATLGTRLSAVSAKPPGDVRLFYQSKDGYLKEHFFKQQSLEWSSSNVPAQYLIAQAPICAICWYADNKESNPRDLRIRVFTIIRPYSQQAAQLVFNLNQGWNSKPMNLVEVLTKDPNYSSAIAACQTTDVAKGAISLFYQPGSQIIDLQPVGVSHGTAGLAEVKDVPIPRGIPILWDVARYSPAARPQARRDVNGRTQLHRAAIDGDFIAAQTIIEAGDTDFNVKDNYKRYPLYYAIEAKRTDIAILLSRKWSIPDDFVRGLISDHTEDSKAKALFTAVQDNVTYTVGFMIEAGANVDARGLGWWPDWNGTPLHQAAYCSTKDAGIIKMLLNAGANKNITDNRGNRPYSAPWNGTRWAELA